MEIKKRTFRTDAVSVTDNAKYEISYIVNEDVNTKELELESLSCIVRKPTEQKFPSADGLTTTVQTVDIELGTLRIQYGRFTCTDGFPYDTNFMLYITDFNEIVQSIVTIK